MKPCDQYQDLFLDYVYGLLEAPETARLSEHVAGCSACGQALANAEQQKRRLAAAARLEFPELRFSAPGPVRVPASEEKADAPVLPYRAHEATWTRWALAAAILIALGGIGVSSSTYWGRHDRVLKAQARLNDVRHEREQLAAERQQRLTESQQKILQTQQAIAKLDQEQSALVSRLLSTSRTPGPRLTISGPSAIEAGAPNTYQVALAGWNDPKPANLRAEVMDQAENRPVATVAVKQEARDRFRLTLPADLPAKPGSDLYLLVDARGSDESKSKARLSEKLALVAPVYLTHLATDKPMYQPGETVHFRSLTLERFSLKPAPIDLHLQYTITTPTQVQIPVLSASSRVTGTDGRPITGPAKKPARGVGAGEYAIGADAPGGEYTLTVSEAEHRFPPQQRKFIVNRYEKSRLNKKLEFSKKTYGPGDEVVASCRAIQGETNLPVVNRPVQATYRIDGAADIAVPGLRTDNQGQVRVRFRLPAKMDQGRGSLTVSFTDGGSVEPIVRTIPIVLKKLRVDFYPEGGDLIAGVANRVYFQARTTLDKPAELKGRIVDTSDGHAIVDAATLNDPDQPGVNQGMGAFTFTPQAGHSYELKITSPEGMEGRYVLPTLKTEGIVLSIPAGVSKPNEPIAVNLVSADKDRHVLVGAYCRGRLMAHERLEAERGKPATVKLASESAVGGVFRVTVFEETSTADEQVKLIPKAERLIYRAPGEQLNLSVRPDKTEYAPGERVTLHYEARNEKNEPQPGYLMVSVVDKSVIEAMDEKTFRSMPTHFLLTTEVRRPEDLEFADFLLSDKPHAAQALDLLLGTQGWRRFVEQGGAMPANSQRDRADVDRLLVLNGNRGPGGQPVPQTAVEELNRRRQNDEYRTERADLGDQLKLALADRSAAATRASAIQATLGELRQHEADAAAQYTDAAESLNNYQSMFRHVILPALAIILAIGLLFAGAVALSHSAWRWTVPYWATATCALALLGVALAWQAQTPDVKSANDAALAKAETSTTSEKLSEALPASATALGAKAGDQQGFPGQPRNEAELRRVLGDMRPETREAGRMPAPPAPVRAAPGGRGGAVPAAEPQNRAIAPLAEGPAPMEKADGAGKGEAKAMPRVYYARPEAAANKPMILDRAADEVPADPKFRGVLLQQNVELGKQAKELDLKLGTRAAGLDARRARPQAEEMPALQPPFGARQLKDAERLDLARANGAMRKRAGREQAFGWARVPPPPPPAPCVVREYAHVRLHGETNVRTDFTETLYWHPVLVLPNGKGESTFELCDSTTTFRVLVAGHTSDGRLGSVTTEFTSRKPLTLEPKLPIEITANDKVDVPLALANNTKDSQAIALSVQSSGLALVGSRGSETRSLQPNQRGREMFRFQPTLIEGEAQVHFTGRSGAYTDDILRTIRVVPEGFPISGVQSDMLEKVAHHDLVLPETWLPGTLKYRVTVYPSTLADLQKGLEAMLREPCGCFEQTSTSNYPNVLILSYLRESNQANPAVAQRANALLARGYQRLTSFECQKPNQPAREGYEWFGGAAPPHEALTAYGLLEFRDMARVAPGLVNAEMLARTRNYLLAQRDGKGGFRRNPRAIDTFGRAPDNVTNAYIVWALTESGPEDDVTRELNALTDQAKTSKDGYFLALVGNSLLNRNRANEALDLLKRIAGAQNADGHVDAEKTSITGSGGRDLQIETTALSLLAWLKAQRPELFNIPVQKAVQWIGKQRGGAGGFGSTQSTILALKALIAYTRDNKKTAEPGELSLFIGTNCVARQAFPAGMKEPIVLELPAPEKALQPGKNEIRIEMNGKNVFPYSAAWTYQSLKPASADNCPIKLETKLDRSVVNEGETVGLTVHLANQSGKGQGMAVAIVGLPAGLSLPDDMKQLKDLARLRNDGTERGQIDAWELRGRELVLYWRDLAPDKRIDVHLDLVCRVPGEYRGPASRGYLYYNADHKFWVEPLAVTIKAKAE